MKNKKSTMACKILALLFVISIASDCDAAARTLKIPLTRSTVQQAGEFGQPVINYYTTVAIGTPEKRFKIQFDVNYNELFVPHYEWTLFRPYLHYSSGFQCKVSSSCVKTDLSLTTTYQNCKLTGKPYEDYIRFEKALPLGPQATSTQSIGQQAQQNSSVETKRFRQNFLAIGDASDGRFKDLEVDGYFGLSPAQQSPNGVLSLLLNLHKADLIDSFQFSFWFNPVLDNDQGGELVIGGIDPSRYNGQIYWHTLNPLPHDQWTLNLQYVTLGQQTISLDCSKTSPCQVVLSTGVSDIYGPRDEVNKLYNLLNIIQPSKKSLPLLDCRRIPQLPTINFMIDGIAYTLLPSNYVRKTVDGTYFKSETCYVAVLPSDNFHPRQWTLGTNFLGAYYSVFDMNFRQVGFASLR